ncbi:30S ribosomal protein S1 [Candidatus Kaiserbacteria bacterium CG10_big_fil_rev_8_21_14_0_10_49_17]|uniref:30S ribosomal protein S1 n=1 Tax=Candidatus Kaiserbacteria bacterium CG10_big_fil_rev_8_21_14_0_10_49_17 TaxID=1974609 RepID=A0A2M6WDK4_9BACT|nr:MAG: 30S ribosomal protein S1 [Candidatus Kaiserbacteria bacterium CG10_big_fil_rev_8_21_14_0_10_49_17]
MDTDKTKEREETVETTEEEVSKKKRESFLGTLLESGPTPPSEGDLVEGPVIAIERSRVYIDLPPFGTGIIYGKEFMSARDILRKVNVGDTIAAKVIDTENEDGYIEVSLKEARQALIWAEAEDVMSNKKTLELPVKEANKGGLIIEWQGIQGFLPASQLGPEHYPRVEDGDKDRILDELKKLVGEKLSLSIITADPKENKLIFSEKGADQKERAEMIDRYSIGDELVGEVTGAVDFGIFVKLQEGLEGLVHISEIDWALVEDPRSLYRVGDTVKVKIIEIKDGKISLSIKALRENPWKSASEKYKKDARVKGVIIKYNKHGALASIEEGVAGLVHISEFEDEQELRNTLELGRTYDFVITLFEPDEQRMTLSYKQAQE